MEKPRVLFISHTFPPITGGVETQNYELSKWLGKIADVKLVTNRRRLLIPFFLFYAAIPALFFKYDVLMLGSCLLGNVGWITKKLRQKPVAAVAHGLDLTWKNVFYQKLWIKFFIPSLDRLIAVGNETIKAGIERGIKAEKFVFIPNGVDTEKNLGNYTRADLEKILEEKLEDRKVLITSGRLAKHKGGAWFIRNVFPKLAENILYVVAGDGPEKENIRNAIQETGTGKRVKMLGYVPDETRNILLNTADLFVQPNIRAEGGYMEGFGISVIEAAACRLPVVASRLEGLKDAIKDGENGFLVEPENAGAYAEKINGLLSDGAALKLFGDQARKYTIEHYSWDRIAAKYLEVLNNLNGS